VAAQAAHELGVVETLRGHYPRMEAWFAEATALADGDVRLLAWTNMYAGLGRTDQADYPNALATLELASEQAQATGDHRALAYAGTRHRPAPPAPQRAGTREDGTGVGLRHRPGARLDVVPRLS
jgi:hypothetical protein